MEILTDLCFLAVGALVTWWASYRYYIKASQRLTTEASELKRFNELILRGLENADIMSLNRDEKGNIIGLNVTVKVHDTIMVHDVAKVKLGDPEKS